MFRIFLITVSLILFLNIASAEIIKDIVVKNNVRVSKGTILTFGDIKKGEDYSTEDLNKSLKNLYDTNFFSDIKINFDNGILTIEVVENKIIQATIINGIKKKEIVKLLKENMQLKDKSPYNDYLALQDLQSIKNALKVNGFYFVKVNSKLVNNTNNTVNLIYEIDLGEKALIDKIEFIGDKIYKDRKLRSMITSEESKFWKFISNKKYLDKNRIDLDKRLLKNFYLNRGHYQVEIVDSFAEYKDDGKFKLIFNINSGPIFTINGTSLQLPDDYDRKNFKNVEEILSKLKGKKYSFTKLSKVVDQIDKISLSRQYEFITASISEKIIDGNLLDLTITVEESEKSYVERIDVLGNNVTLENVVRNALEVDEGDPFNELLHAKSINNLKSKGIFAKVESEVIEGSNPGTKIIKISVEEKPTGEISLGAGVGSDGGTLGFSVRENNFLGKDIKLITSLRVSEDKVKGQFKVVNPNYNYSDKALSANVQSIVTDKLSSNGYKSNKTGFSFGTNFEQYEDLFIFPEIGTFYEDLTTDSTASASLKKQEGSYFDTSLNYSIVYDKRNQRFQTTEGFRSSFTQKLPIVSDSAAILNGYEFDRYQTFGNNYITKIGLYTRAINSISNDDVRISSRVSLPSKYLRGFETGKIGPVDSGDHVGGNYATSLGFSSTLPMILPTVQNADFQFFVDAGNVWGVDYNSALDESNKIRSSVGIGVNWYTPVGPLSLTFAEPITKASTDKTQSLQFNLGTTF